MARAKFIKKAVSVWIPAGKIDLTTINKCADNLVVDNTAKIPSDCCDESKQDLRDWIECGFKFCPWCGRELRPIMKGQEYEQE